MNSNGLLVGTVNLCLFFYFWFGNKFPELYSRQGENQKISKPRVRAQGSVNFQTLTTQRNHYSNLSEALPIAQG